MPLSDEQVKAYDRDGFLGGIRIADDAAAARYRELFDRLEAAEGREKCAIGLLDRHVDQPFIWELATHTRILDCMESLVGPDILLLATQFFCKYGQDGKFVAWHQDLTYWGLEPPLAVTAWYAIDDSDCGNGCMRVIPGTHRGGIREHGKAERQGNLLSINQSVSVRAEDEARAVDLVLTAGEISIHHGELVHGSLPNCSGRRRCGLTMRYVPPHVKPVRPNSRGEYWQATLVRGRDTHQNFPSRSAPIPQPSC